MKKNLPRNFLKTDAEKAIKNTVLACMRDSAPDGELLDCLRLLVQQEGCAACTIILELLMHRNFRQEEAAHYWQDIVAHHRMMSVALGRVVGLSVAVCDYFSLHDKGASVAKLIDVHEFEAMYMERQFDSLTGLYNKQTMESALRQEFSRAERHQRRLSILFLDLDAFKKINDSHGHLAGDKMMQHVGRILEQNKRSVDIAARFGGDEFVLVLPDTGKGEALGLAERIRTEISRETMVVENREVGLTVSGGIATYPDDARNCEDVFHCADKALYRAKHLGKNIVLAHGQKICRGKRLKSMIPGPLAEMIPDAFSSALSPGRARSCLGTQGNDPEIFAQAQ
jgi:diguanylate cyclase (GGDEF)-like protein